MPPIASAQQTPEPIKTSITVSEKITADAPASITTFSEKELQQLPGINLDDRLRVLPGFSLFRRSSSLVANPTTQGVSLRGIGSTGASRTLVLWDGIPINDPFGGWVYWTRVAPDQLERVEVTRSAATSLFGDLAMGGSVGLFSRETRPSRYDFSYEGGSNNTHELEASASQGWRDFAASAQVRAFSTDGYFIVPGNLRGAADQLANVRFVAGAARFDYLEATQRLFFKLDILAEDRGNGTVAQRNSTSLGTLAAHYEREFAHDVISVLAYHTREEFRASFSAVAADRNTERLTSLQTVPSETEGAAAYWRRSERNWHLLAGADVQRVEGYSTDQSFPTGRKVGGGTLLEHGVFGQFDVRLGPAQFFAGARHTFTGLDRTFFSPSAGLTIEQRWIRARASINRSFRSPTLNELYRDFRQGNALTQANPLLRQETLFGAEAGVDFVGESHRASITVFRNSLKDLISNVTLSTTGNSILRQRQNAADALSRGVEFQVRQNWKQLQGEASYLFVDSALVTGPLLPQVPKHQGSGQVTYQWKRTFASAGVRGYSLQFDDDRNQFRLPGFATAQLVVRQGLLNHVSASLSFENLLDRTYLVAFSPTPNIGPPRLWRAGIRWDSR